MEPISRRGFLSGTCGIAALSVLGGASPAAANASVTRLRSGQVSVKLKAIPELARVGGAVAIGNVKGKPIAISRTGQSTYIAFSLNCPHQGVTVGRTDSGWRCEAHGSEFTAKGDLVLGPATTRLARVPIKVRRGTAVVG